MPLFIPDLTKLWDTSYLFGPVPFVLSRSDLIFFWIAIAFVLAAILIKIMVVRQEQDSPRRFFLGRVFHLFFATGFLVLVWTGARNERIPMVSTRIVVLGLFVIFAIWLGFIVKYYFKKFRILQKAWEEDKIKRKYLSR